MKKCFFLGANSSNGFYSLYNKFPPEKSFLHIIKSGPGTGKSTFMRKIAQAAELKGFDVEYILCSGDPSSLDGIYIPALKEAWVDGTAPHIIEPSIFGVYSDYVNLGSFLDEEFTDIEMDKIKELNKTYKAQYKQAYKYLAATGELIKAIEVDFWGDTGRNAIQRRISTIFKHNLGQNKTVGGNAEYRFISAVSHLGIYRLNSTVNELCKLIYQFDTSLNALSFSLEYAAKEAMSRGADVIICPSPLWPEEIEAVLIPSHSIALLGNDWQFSNAKNIHIDRWADEKLLLNYKNEIRENHKLEKMTMELAISKLHYAKTLHDELEEIYKKHMNYSALNKFTDSYIENLLQ